MPRDMFTEVESWIFDLDNTLYPPSAALFDQMDVKMSAFISEALGVDDAAASAMRSRFYAEYGTTLNGLMKEHNMEPDAFLEAVHDIDLSNVTPDQELRTAIDALPGRKIVHTNGSRDHAARVLDRLGIPDLFEAVYAIEDKSYVPKPKRAAYDHVLGASDIDAGRAAMFEDTSKNLRVPHKLGMKTVLVHAPSPMDADYVHFEVDRLPDFLRLLVT